MIDLAPRPWAWPFSLEKWYCDALLADGTVLLVYLASMRVLGVPLARVTAELFRPGQPVIRGDAAARGVTGGPGWLRFGPASIDGDRLTWTTPGLSGELNLRPRHPPATLREPFLERGGRRLLWTVEVPDADVSGHVRWPGGSLQVHGRSYRDRVWFDLPPWRFPLDELRWGRAVAGDHAATWVEARTAEGLVRAGWRDGELVDGEPPELGASRVLIDAAIVDLEGLRLGPTRPLLRRVFRDPREVKWAAPATLDGEAGRAVHEVVRWC